MSPHELSCVECGGRLIQDHFHGEVVCTHCGLVNQEAMIVEDFQESISHENGNWFWGEKDGKGNTLSERRKHHLRNLKRLDQSSQIKNGTERNLKISLQELRRMVTYLYLPEHIASTSALFYRFAVIQKLTVGRNAEDFLAASLYCACLKSHHPLTLAELLTSLERMGWHFSQKKVGKAVKLLKRELHLKAAPPTPQLLISRFCSRLQLDKEIEKKTRDILFQIQKKELLDGRPGGIAAAAIYIASHLCGKKVSQKHLAQVAGVTDNTLRSQYKNITKTLNINIVRN